MPATSTLSKLLNGIGKFVVDQNGQWGHDEWEELVEDSRALGYPFDEDECKRNLGNILEASKYFFLREPGSAPAPAIKTAPAKKAAPRKKPAS